jgi:aconitate hydratase
MAEKILGGRQAAGGATFDQIALVRTASFAAALDAAGARGSKRVTCEVAVAYETACASEPSDADRDGVRAKLLARGVLVARAGAGFPAPVHLERFASPARLCASDDPRFASVGGIGMLAVHVASPATLGAALAGDGVAIGGASGATRSVHVQLSGRTRAFVCVRDVALELVRRGLADIVARAGAPGTVVVEFGGPSVRLLSVGERAVIASIAPRVGALAAIFPSDERTELYLRDQRRSKAHRALAPDPGAPFADVMQVDLGAVDPLVLDDAGKVRAARELAGKPVSQVVLGGDTGATLRDLLAAAMLLKSKRVPAGVDLLLAPPTRQMLEVLAQEGALTDLIATGARIVEPDARVASGAFYPPRASGLALQSFDVADGASVARTMVASPETLAYAVATGALGDPRGFKRQVRVTVPRTLPTDDVLVIRAK